MSITRESFQEMLNINCWGPNYTFSATQWHYQDCVTRPFVCVLAGSSWPNHGTAYRLPHHLVMLTLAISIVHEQDACCSCWQHVRHWKSSTLQTSNFYLLPNSAAGPGFCKQSWWPPADLDTYITMIPEKISRGKKAGMASRRHKHAHKVDSKMDHFSQVRSMSFLLQHWHKHLLSSDSKPG